MTESTETNCSGRISKKVRTLAIGALATAALSLPAVSAVSLTAHDASKAPAKQQPVKVSPSSHRLALSVKPNSVRLI